MMGVTHRDWGIVSGAALSATFGFDPLAVLVCAAAGYYCATWPDRIEKVRVLPFRKHRGMSHSWELNVLVMLLAWVLPPIVDYPFWALALAWNSHITGDFMFGKAGYGRGAGVPFFLGTHHHGLGIFKVGNLTEKGVHAVLHAFRFAVVAVAFIYSIVRLAGGM